MRRSCATKGQFDSTPGIFEALYGLGRAWREKGDLNKAIAAFQESARVDPGIANTHSSLGATLAMRKDYSGAVAALRAAMNLNPTVSALMIISPRHCKKRTITWERLLPFARLLKTIRKTPPDKTSSASPSWAYLIGPGRLLHPAAARINPSDPAIPWMQLRLADACNRARDFDGAVIAAREAARSDPRSAYAYDVLRHNLGQTHDLQGALAAAKEAARLAPNFADYKRFLAQAYRDTGDAGGAVLAYREAIRLDPANRLSYDEYSQLLVSQGRSAESVALWQQGFEKNPRWAKDWQINPFDAPFVAAIAGTNQGGKTATPAQQASYRKQALEWLHNDLALVKKVVAKDPNAIPADRVRHWLAAPEFKALRPPFADFDLPADEKEAWTKFWADVQKLQDAIDPTKPEKR